MREVSGEHNLRGVLILGSRFHGAENGCFLNTCTFSALLSPTFSLALPPYPCFLPSSVTN